jgi:hypothetical protein
MVLCGGPSLNDFEDEIIKLRNEGMPMVTCNGTYNWAVERGLNPSMQMIIDARPFNKRFTRPVVDGCKYFISSQCDPSIFEGLPKENTWLWHVSGLEDGVKELLDELYPDWCGASPCCVCWVFISSTCTGSTVATGTTNITLTSNRRIITTCITGL